MLHMLTLPNISCCIFKSPLYLLLLVILMKLGFFSIFGKFMGGVNFMQIDFFVFFGFYTSKGIIDERSSMKFQKKGQIEHPNIYIYLKMFQFF